MKEQIEQGDWEDEVERLRYEAMEKLRHAKGKEKNKENPDEEKFRKLHKAFWELADEEMPESAREML